MDRPLHGRQCRRRGEQLLEQRNGALATRWRLGLTYLLLLGGLATTQAKPVSLAVSDTSWVEVEPGLRLRKYWLTLWPHYAAWSSQKINPYTFNPVAYQQAASLELYNSSKNELWSPPVAYTSVSSHFGMRGKRFHYGIDLALKPEARVFSVFDGIVRLVAYDDDGYGNFMIVRHKNGLETLYAHLNYFHAEVGQEVEAGEIIGLMGSTGHSTGSHLHFGLLYQGRYLNPALLFDFSGLQAELKGQRFVLLPQHFAHVGNPYRMTVKYRVRTGDTLDEVSDKYGVPVNRIMKINRMKTPAIRPNQWLVIQN